MTGASLRETGSREPSPSGLGPSGFDLARGGLFRRRPVEVEAFQWVNQDRNDWPEWAAEDDRLEELCAALVGVAAVRLKVWTLEGGIHARHGDWIIKGEQGELYPCKPHIFAATYDAIAMEARQGTDPQGLDGEAATARAVGIAKEQSQ